MSGGARRASWSVYATGGGSRPPGRCPICYEFVPQRPCLIVPSPVPTTLYRTTSNAQETGHCLSLKRDRACTSTLPASNRPGTTGFAHQNMPFHCWRRAYPAPVRIRSPDSPRSRWSGGRQSDTSHVFHCALVPRSGPALLRVRLCAARRAYFAGKVTLYYHRSC